MILTSGNTMVLKWLKMSDLTTTGLGNVNLKCIIIAQGIQKGLGNIKI